MATKRIPRPRDPIALAKLIGDIATGQVADTPDDGKDQAVSEAGRKGGLRGGKARVQQLSPQQRIELAKAAASVRWKKSD